MATVAQINANQHNAALSTGPRSDAGKQRSAANASSHGLSAASTTVLPHESAAEYQSLLADYLDQFQPATPHETFLVHQMTHARWRLTRIQRLELSFLTGDADPADAAILEKMSARSADVLSALNRYSASAERSYYRAHKELQNARQNEANLEARSAAAATKREEARFLALLNAPLPSLRTIPDTPRPILTDEEKKHLALRL